MHNAIILAAGKGTRMKSGTCKVMHPIIDRPMIRYSIDALKKAGVSRIILVTGHQAEMVEEAFPDLESARQEPQLGSGHAVMQAGMLEGEPGLTLVVNGDGPCIQPETLKQLLEEGKDASLVLLSSILEDGAHYGRVIRNEAGRVTGIVEAKDCTPEQRAVREVNAGIYCFDNRDLFEGLKLLDCDNAQHEYYITDLAKILADQGKVVKALPVDQDETMGINDPVELAKASRWITDRINTEHMKNGVQMMDPSRTVIGPDVVIGQDVILWPDVEITGSSVLEDGVQVRSGSRLHNAHVKKNARIEASTILNETIQESAKIGPYEVVGQEQE